MTITFLNMIMMLVKNNFSKCLFLLLTCFYCNIQAKALNIDDYYNYPYNNLFNSNLILRDSVQLLKKFRLQDTNRVLIGEYFYNKGCLINFSLYDTHISKSYKYTYLNGKITKIDYKYSYIFQKCDKEGLILFSYDSNDSINEIKELSEGIETRYSFVRDEKNRVISKGKYLNGIELKKILYSINKLGDIEKIITIELGDTTENIDYYYSYKSGKKTRILYSYDPEQEHEQEVIVFDSANRVVSNYLVCSNVTWERSYTYKNNVLMRISSDYSNLPYIDESYSYDKNGNLSGLISTSNIEVLIKEFKYSDRNKYIIEEVWYKPIGIKEFESGLFAKEINYQYMYEYIPPVEPNPSK